MGFSDEVERLLSPVEGSRPELSVAAKPVSPPWTAGVEIEGSEGEIRTKALGSPQVEWDEQLREWGFDPALYEVVEPVRVATWQVLTKNDEGDYAERQLWAYRARIQSRSHRADVDFDALCKPILKVKPHKIQGDGEWDLVVPLGDWQIGKNDGDGLDGTVERINRAIESVARRINALRDAGYRLRTLVVLSAGDLGEGCTGHYEQQTFGVELDRRDQNKVIRRLIRNALMLWAPMFDDVVVAAVGGNHGENRRDSKSFTSSNDNDDVAVFEAVAEALQMNPDAFGHIRWLLPRNQLSISFDVNGVIVGLAHGHQARTNDIVKWWQSQVLGNRPIASCDILVTGHFHHFRMIEAAKRKWWLQIPAMDGGSEWFEEMAGHGNTAGQVVFLMNESGWRELMVL